MIVIEDKWLCLGNATLLFGLIINISHEAIQETDYFWLSHPRSCTPDNYLRVGFFSPNKTEMGNTLYLTRQTITRQLKHLKELEAIEVFEKRYIRPNVSSELFEGATFNENLTFYPKE